jgi:hypothetical protein
LLEQLEARLRRKDAPASLRWLRVSVGQSLRMVSVDEIDFLRSDEKYTVVAWRGDDGRAHDGLIRTPLKELLTQLDATRFAQVRCVLFRATNSHRLLVGRSYAVSLAEWLVEAAEEFGLVHGEQLVNGEQGDRRSAVE